MARKYPNITTGPNYLAALGDRDPIESMRKTRKRLAKAIKGLSKSELARCVEEGKWSIKQVIAHLADGEVVLGARIRMIVAMDRPALTGYDQDAFVRNLAYDGVSVDDLLDQFGAIRAANVALLERLDDAAFARVGLHSERGEESLATAVFMYAGHDRLHEAQIERLRGALKVARKVERKAERKAVRKSSPKATKQPATPSKSADNGAKGGSKKKRKVLAKV